jgi:succinyl-diaminopimelate desuccinylase
MADLLALTASLVDIPSVSLNEEAITDHLEALLAPVPWLTTVRVGNNLAARTRLGRGQRLLLAGHTDTVPPNGNEKAVIEGDVLWGIGSADMKAGDALLLDLATTISDPAVDVTYVFYQCEELAGSVHNGVEQLFQQRPDLLEADAVILAEPTGGRVEAGCQGIFTGEVTVLGQAAHAARGWLGRNAIHGLSTVLTRLAAYENRRVTIDGCDFVEGMQAVEVSGGIAHNVVPDRATLLVTHRFAPDHDYEAAEAEVRAIIGDVDSFRVTDRLPAAPPALDHPLFSSLLTLAGGPPRAKLGWTDVARFASHGIPATNFGPGDPTLAHTVKERVTRAELERAHGVLRALIQGEGA